MKMALKAMLLRGINVQRESGCSYRSSCAKTNLNSHIITVRNMYKLKVLLIEISSFFIS